jgi:RNA polymerase sigma-70 factor (ECF subfamily)
MSVSGATKQELEALYVRRHSHFVRVATGILGDEDRGADAVQDAFAAALRRRRAFRRDGPLEAWVWRIVVNTAKRERTRASPAPLDAHVEPTDEGGTVRDAVAELPERQRLVLFLRYYADLDYASIAAALEIAPGTVAASLHAAHRSLRRQLEEART